MDLRDKRIIVTGGLGFLGSHLVERLRAQGAGPISTPRSAECDLVDPAAVQRLFAEFRPDMVFHLAARVGGIGANQKNPGAYFHDNMMMGVNVFFQISLQIFFWGLIGLGLGLAVRVTGAGGRLVNIWRFGDERLRPVRVRAAVALADDEPLVLDASASATPRD